jgi:PST family polysaccharide transporter
MVRWIPGRPLRGSGVRSLIGFGGNVAGSYLILSIIRGADNILIGWYWGAGPLGLYSRAYNLLMLPIRQIGGAARAVTVPAFSRVQADPERFARYYLQTVNVIMWICAPLFGILFVAAEPVIILVLGNRWKDAAPVFQILCICAMSQMLIESVIWLLISRGQSRRLMMLVSMTSPVIVLSYAAGLRFGIRAVALSGSIAMLLSLAWMLKLSFRGTLLTVLRLVRSIACPIGVTISGVAAAEVALRLIAPQYPIPQMVVTTLSFAVALAAATLFPSVRMELMSLKSLIKQHE